MDFRDTFKLFWDDFRTKKPSFKSLQRWWDFGKVQVKQFCQQYIHNSSRELIQSLKALETDVIKPQLLTASTGDPNYMELLSKRKTQLADISGVKALGVLVRSRFQTTTVQ